MSAPVQVASDLRTPPLRPTTVAWLGELHARLDIERLDWKHVHGLPRIPYGWFGREEIAGDLDRHAADRDLLRQESLYLNLTPHRPQEGPPW